jgi:Fe-S cluster assembly ATP-binding protein
MKLLTPSYIILDEIDSGLDLDAFKSVVSFLSSIKTEEISFIIVSHYFTIFDSL